MKSKIKYIFFGISLGKEVVNETWREIGSNRMRRCRRTGFRAFQETHAQELTKRYNNLFY